MEKRSDRYNNDEEAEKKISSRVSKNQLLYDEINSKIGFEEIPTYDSQEEINLSTIDMENLKRSDYQKVKDYKELLSDTEKKEAEEPKQEIKKKTFDINKVLEEAKKNREIDEQEEKRNLKEEDYNVLNNLNKKYLHQKGFSEEDNEELKELIDTITSKTLVDDIKDEEEKELLSELLATTIDIKLENELSKTQIEEIAEEKINEEDLVSTDSFYSKSLELSKEDLIDDKEEKKEQEENEDELDIEEEQSISKIIFISLILLIIVLVVVYFILQFLGVSF
ncbi:MAG: hypothetical protein IJ568_04150 [Bacilli bacterium]|nr:hypothetical protein [Bacilli bacterium]